MPRKVLDIAARRQYIFRRVVLDNRPLSLRDLRERLHFTARQYTRRTANFDIAAFRAVGCNIKLRDGDKDQGIEFVFTEGPHTDDDSLRAQNNPIGKSLVAQFAAALICGFSPASQTALLFEKGIDDDAILPRADDDTINRILKTLTTPAKGDAATITSVVAMVHQFIQNVSARKINGPIPAGAEIEKLIERSRAINEKVRKRLRTKLHSFWGEANRVVAIDSGTTNVELARYLRDLLIPLPGCLLCSLSICTNSRRIFEVLGPSNVAVKTIIVGGQQKFHSPTIAGAMAEQFLKTSPILQFGICILGATKIDLERFAFCSDSQEEASMKTLFMEKSSLRIACVDDSKLQFGPGREGYKFASVDPQHIDMVLTNCPPADSSQETYDAFLDKVGAIEARGVPVLIATSSLTYPHPADGKAAPTTVTLPEADRDVERPSGAVKAKLNSNRVTVKSQAQRTIGRTVVEQAECSPTKIKPP